MNCASRLVDGLIRTSDFGVVIAGRDPETLDRAIAQTSALREEAHELKDIRKPGSRTLPSRLGAGQSEYGRSDRRRFSAASRAGWASSFSRRASDTVIPEYLAFQL